MAEPPGSFVENHAELRELVLPVDVDFMIELPARQRPRTFYQLLQGIGYALRDDEAKEDCKKQSHNNASGDNPHHTLLCMCDGINGRRTLCGYRLVDVLHEFRAQRLQRLDLVFEPHAQCRPIARGRQCADRLEMSR